jgi:signal recognition particle receptor subunit beta
MLDQVYGIPGIVVLVLVLLVTILALRARNKPAAAIGHSYGHTKPKTRVKRDLVLVCGHTGAGKTAFVQQLCYNTAPATVMSTMESTHALENEEGESKVDLVDLPGHPRLRPLTRDYLRRAKGLILVVDSSASSLTETAELCVDVFSRLPYYIASSSVVGNASHHHNDDEDDDSYVLPILVVCTKSDLITSKTVSRIQSSLQTEITRLKKERANELSLHRQKQHREEEEDEDNEDDEIHSLSLLGEEEEEEGSEEMKGKKKASAFLFKELPDVTFVKVNTKDGAGIERVREHLLAKF